MITGLMDTPQEASLNLDPGIRNFVLIPIIFVVFLKKIYYQCILDNL